MAKGEKVRGSNLIDLVFLSVVLKCLPWGMCEVLQGGNVVFSPVGVIISVFLAWLLGERC